MKKRLWKERRRIARDLHDTVSQELFAANMILSGVASQDQVLQLLKVGQQLKGVTEILNTAQNDFANFATTFCGRQNWKVGT